MIITEDNKSKSRIVVFSEEEWNTLILHREYCFKLMFDPDSDFEMPQETFVVWEDFK